MNSLFQAFRYSVHSRWPLLGLTGNLSKLQLPGKIQEVSTTCVREIDCIFVLLSVTAIEIPMLAARPVFRVFAWECDYVKVENS